MAIRPILKYPDPRLQQISRRVTDPTALGPLIRDMADTMYASKGAGLAAIQIGEPLQLFIVDAPLAGGEEEEPPLVFINPEVVELSRERETAEEGCLSFPGIYVPVERSLRAIFRAQDLEGRPFEASGEDFFARAMQHEFDHLNGKLLADYVGRIKRQLILRKLSRQAAEDDE